MKYIEIKQSLNRLLKKKYPDLKIYGKEIKEGYEAPCFFTEIVQAQAKAQNKNFEKISFTLSITYFQEIKSELDQLKKIDEIKELFGMKFQVGNHLITTGEYTFDFIGEYSDILRISIEFEYLEAKQREERGEKMEEIKIDLKIRKEREDGRARSNN